MLQTYGPFVRGPSDGTWPCRAPDGSPIVLVDTRRLPAAPGTAALALMGRLDAIGPRHIRALLTDPTLGHNDREAILEELMRHQRAHDPNLAEMTVKELIEYGLAEGQRRGHAQGLAEGQRRGHAQGLAEGRAALLTLARSLLDADTVAALARIEDLHALREALSEALSRRNPPTSTS